eukprot:2084188-Ditylum_brightwellii.AAC.1
MTITFQEDDAQNRLAPENENCLLSRAEQSREEKREKIREYLCICFAFCEVFASLKKFQRRAKMPK